MVLFLRYLAGNLGRNPLRTFLTIAAVALPMTIFVLSISVVAGVERFLENSVKQLRLVVTHKASIVNPLPYGYRAKIEALDPTRTRIRSVCGLSWIGGQIENLSFPLSTLAVDADTFPATFDEHLRNPAELEAWRRERQALVAGRGTAASLGWKVGDRVTLRPSVPPYAPLEFVVVSTAPDVEDAVTNFCRLDYYWEKVREAGGREGLVSNFFVKCGAPADIEFYRVEIDRLFANAIDETLTQDEKSFMNQFITQQFDLPRNLTILAAVTVFVAVLAAANTMSMNFRDRISEYATLKSLGFGGTTVFALIQSESLLLCALGGVMGVGLPWWLFTHTPLADVPLPLIQNLEVTLDVCGWGLAIALAIGIVAALGPAQQARRLQVVAALRNLE